MKTSRRDFLGLLGKGAVVVGAGGLIVPAAKKIWQVHPNTPLRRSAEVEYVFDAGSGNWYADPPKAYTPRQFEDILQSTIQTVRDNYGQPTDMYLNSKDFAALEQELKEEWSGYDGLDRLLKEPVVVHKPQSLGCTTYDLMKRMHNSLYPVRTENLITALKHIVYEPNNIKMWG